MFFGAMVAVLLGANPSVCAGQEDDHVVVATLDWQPYIGKDLPGFGYVGQVVSLAFERTGYTVSFQFLPWARTVISAGFGEVAAYGPEYQSEERTGQFLFSDPFPGGPLVLMKRADRDILYHGLDSLVGYDIGVVRGYVNSEEFDTHPGLKRVEARDDATNVKMLMNGRLDLIVIDRLVGARLVRGLFPGRADELAEVGPPLAEHALYMCFPLSHPRHEELAGAFNEGLRQLREDGTLARLYSPMTD